MKNRSPLPPFSPVNPSSISRVSCIWRFDSFPVPIGPGRIRLTCRRNRHITFRRLRDSISRLNALALLALLTAFASGCQVLSYTSASGEHFTRSSLGANTSLHSLAFEATTNGLRRVELRGYQNDSSQALGAITDAAVKAAITAVKP